MPLRPWNKQRVVLPVLSEEIDFKHIPAHIVDHIKKRLDERVWNLDDVREMKVWAQSKRMAPRKEWYKEFKTFYLCGYGKSLATVLDRPGKVPHGIKISKKASLDVFTDQILARLEEDPFDKIPDEDTFEDVSEHPGDLGIDSKVKAPKEESVEDWFTK